MLTIQGICLARNDGAKKAKDGQNINVIGSSFAVSTFP
jgi:hypothetical protein